MYPESSEGLNKETAEAVYFYTPAFHPLDNFSAHQVNIWNQTFATAEHAYQWKKFSDTDPDIAEQIRIARSPKVAKSISDTHVNDLPDTWHDNKTSIMKEVLSAKLTQNEDVQEVLEKTGTRTIYENSPIDAFWGVGQEGNGENTLGKLWMELRETL